MAIASLLASMATWLTPPVLFCALNLMVATIFVASNFNKKQHHHHYQEINHNSLSPLVHTPLRLLERVKSIGSPSFYGFEFDHTREHNSPSQLARAPSLLERVRSIKYFSSYYPHESEQTGRPGGAPSLLERVRSIDFSSFYQNDPVQLHENTSQLGEGTESNSPGRLGRAPSLLDRVKSFRISSLGDSGNGDVDPREERDHHVIRSKSEKSAVAPAKKMKKSRSEMRMAATNGGSDEEDVDRRRPATMREVVATAEDEGVDAKADDFISKFRQQLKLQRLDSIVRYTEMLKRGTSSL